MTSSFKESAETLLQDLVSNVAPADDGHSLYETSEEQDEVNATFINETLTALVRLHQQEMLKVIPSKIDNWKDVGSKVAFKNIPMTNHNASRWRQGFNAAVDEIRTNLNNTIKGDK